MGVSKRASIRWRRTVKRRRGMDALIEDIVSLWMRMDGGVIAGQFRLLRVFSPDGQAVLRLRYQQAELL